MGVAPSWFSAEGTAWGFGGAPHPASFPKPVARLLLRSVTLSRKKLLISSEPLPSDFETLPFLFAFYHPNHGEGSFSPVRDPRRAPQGSAGAELRREACGAPEPTGCRQTDVTDAPLAAVGLMSGTKHVHCSFLTDLS